VGREYRDFVFEKIKTPPPPRFDALSWTVVYHYL
jgi:hypothetical protein